MTKQNKTETKNRNNRMERFVKRSTDILVSVPCLVLSSPLFVIISLAIKWEDGLPIIYKQERIGLHGKPFNIYKFRSMKADAEKDGPNLLEIEGDTRLTRVGKFIRTHHLDELPQLWNILKGDMSLVGPRPERKYYIDQIMEHDPRYTYLYQIRPGATSYATLYNGYTDTMPKIIIICVLNRQMTVCSLHQSFVIILICNMKVMSKSLKWLIPCVLAVLMI